MDSPRFDTLLAIATDVLAQGEARQRAIRRLQQTAQDLSHAIRERGGADALHMQKLREHVSAIRDLGDIERALLDEFDSALADFAR